MNDTAEHVVAWTEYAVQFADGWVTRPLPYSAAVETWRAHNALLPGSGVAIVARTVTPWRPL